MKKKLLIYRHAKSDWYAEYMGDQDRPLAKRGIKSAKMMGKLLQRAKQVPELIISSSAVRASQTAKISMKNANWKCKFETNSILYFSSTIDIMTMLQSISDQFNCIAIVSHEPTCSTLISSLTGGINVRFPTAAMARIDFEVMYWREIQVGYGELRWLLQPAFFLK